MKHKLFITGLLMSMLLFPTGCDKYLDINDDPSLPQVAEGFAILPPVLYNMVRGESFDQRYVGMYVQNWARTTSNYPFDQHGYLPGSDAAGEKWRQHYWAIGKNIDLIIEQATAKEQWDYVGVAKAIRAWSWQTSTDVYGEMILTQAWEPNRYVFDFDDQQPIFDEVVRLSMDALTDLNRTDGGVNEASLGRGDLVYDGDRSKWIKFVYSTLARNAHRLTNKASYDPDKVIEYVDKSFTSNADNFNVPHAGTSSADGNFFGPTRNNLAVFRQTPFIVSLLDGTVFNGVADPRLPLMLSASPDGVYRGATPTVGDTTNVTGNPRRIPLLWGTSPAVGAAGSQPGKYIFKDAADHPLVTYSELQFIKAEAAFIKNDKPMAFSAFKNAVRAHMDFAGVPTADQDTYMASAAMPQTENDLTLSDIMLQKYVSLWVHGAIETWVDLRRYHYDSQVYTGFTLPATLYLDNNGKPAYRFRPRYNSEYVWNRQSLDRFGGNNPDYHTYEMWFTKP